MPSDHETFHHQADIGVRGQGRTLGQAFAHAAMALTEVVCDPGLVRPERTLNVELAEDDPELLLYAWLSEVVTLMDVERMLFSRFVVHVADGRLQAELSGEGIDRERHRPAVEIKAVTFHQLKVERGAGGLWLAQAVVDV